MSLDGLLDHRHIDCTSVKTFSALLPATEAGEAHIPAKGMNPVFATRSPRLLRQSSAATICTLSHRYASISKRRKLWKSRRVMHGLRRVNRVRRGADRR